MKKLLSIMIFLILIMACQNNKEIIRSSDSRNKKISNSMGQSTILYKTSRNFDDYVPVIMNTERTKIISYPAPTDLISNGKLLKPVALNKGYLLDNRGITENVVFANYTYEIYSRLKEAPTLSEILENIKEKYPLLECIYCGSRYKYKNEIKELNALIDSGFPGCKKADIIPMGVNLKIK